MSRRYMALVGLVGLVLVPACLGAPEAELGDEQATVEEHGQGLEALKVCGDNTVASVIGTNKNRLTFCVFDNGLEIVTEDGAEGSTPPAGDSPAGPLVKKVSGCAVDIYVEKTAADVPVPVRLIESCERKTQVNKALGDRVTISNAVLQAEPQELSPSLAPQGVSQFDQFNSFYCTGGQAGVAAFVDERCLLCGSSWDPDECSSVCVSQFWGTSIRVCPEGDIADETIVSCSGWTHMRGLWREGAGDPWLTRYDSWVAQNHWRYVSILDGDSFADADMEFITESDPGASHLHSFRCIDD